MTTVLVVDDEQPARRRIVSYLETLTYIKNILVANNGKEAIEKIMNNRPDVVFLDINMPPGMNGIEVLAQLPEECTPATVFTTAYDEYAIEAFEKRAVDYLLKPIGKDRFIQALNRALSMGYDKPGKRYWQENVENDYISRILCRYASRFVVLHVENVLYITTEYRDVFVFTKDGNKYSTNKQIDDLEKSLNPKDFFRIHRSSIVNLNSNFQIEPWQDGRLKLIFNKGSEIIVSRSQAKNFKQLLGISKQ